MARHAWQGVSSGGLALVVFLFASCSGRAGAGDAPKAGTYVVRSDNLAIVLSARGEIVRATLAGGTIKKAIRGCTALAGCRVLGEVSRTALDNGGIQFRRELANENNKRKCVLVERFTPTAGSVRWEIEIHGAGNPWTAPIETHLYWPDLADATFWTAWGDSRPDTPPRSTRWTDPLVPTPFKDFTLSYGSRHFSQSQAISIPIVTALEKSHDIALSLVLSPEDLILDMNLAVTKGGRMIFSRTNHRIAKGRPVRFAMDLVAHAADWRAGLGWMVLRYPQFFAPPNPLAHQIAGCGAYSSHADISDPEKLKRMAFRVNWKASFDFPYMGMFLPPVRSDEEQWIDFKKKPTSIRRMRDYSRRMRGMGFYVLNYFNVTEFGAHIKYPPPPRKSDTDADLWKDAHDFLYYKLADAILPGPQGKPIRSWEGCVAMDPGEPVYQQFLLDQARRHIDKLPESSGICIDRMDWTRFYNPTRDDGVSWVGGRAARSLVVSWHDIMGKLGPLMHAAGKVIFCNPHYRRVDLVRRMDGIYDEFGQYGHSLNLCALLCVRKPVIEWTIVVDQLRTDPDAYFQRHLHMGAYLTAPLPGNDHTILPAPRVERYYLDYGPLLDAMRGKRWVLRPHVIEVPNGKAKANLFQVPAGYVVPVTFGRDESSAEVLIRGVPNLTDQKTLRIEAIHPGTNCPEPVKSTQQNGLLMLDVPLRRGCAMVKISHATTRRQTDR